MRHVPHIYLPRPWVHETLRVGDETTRHMERVLRRGDGDPVTYTDGEGSIGTGTYQSGAFLRGDEVEAEPRSRSVTLAVAPPRSTDRQRFLVEKLAELGVDRLFWLDTAHGEGRAPRMEKTRAWAIGALQQSRGAWLMEISGPVPVSGPWRDALFAGDPDGHPAVRVIPADEDVVLLIGPEGGFAPEEIPDDAVPMSLGARVLRVETAAVVAATAVLLGSA